MERYIEVLTALDEIKSKLIEVPKSVLDALNEDAKRCRRSLNKHIEAILVAYLNFENVELNDIKRVQNNVKEKVGRPAFRLKKNKKDERNEGTG
jgi:hypothetical protein